MGNGIQKMNEITDPNLISKLEANSSGSAPNYSGRSPITDPDIISQLENSSSPNGASQQLENLANQQRAQPEPSFLQRTPMMQEEYSDPTNWPGFENLPESEKLQRIEFSMFDPANQSPLGTMEGPGAYTNPIVRLVASTLPTLAAPEIKAGGPLVRGLVNSLSRIGAGTLGNIAYQSPNIKNMQDFVNVSQESEKLNAILEGATAPLRMASQLGEVFNPVNLANNKLNAIKSDYQAAKSATASQYNPVMDKYGNELIDMKNNNRFLDAFSDYSDELGTKVNKMQKKFMENPTIQNAHNTQSQMFSEISNLSQHNPDAYTLDRINALTETRNALKQDLLGTLEGIDPNAADMYRTGAAIHRDQVVPYFSSPALSNIVEGEVNSISPSALSSSISKPIEKGSMPMNHPLRQHLSDIDNAISRGRFMQVAFPAAAGALAGQYTHPGFTGAIGGAVGGLGLSGAASIASKLGGTTVTGLLQEPWVVNWLNRLAPYYYTGGRALSGVESGKK